MVSDGPSYEVDYHIFIISLLYYALVASRLVSSLASWTLVLHNALSTASDDVPLGEISSYILFLLSANDRWNADTESACALCRPMMQALAILQGVSLLHGPSKRFLARRWCIQVCNTERQDNISHPIHFSY